MILIRFLIKQKNMKALLIGKNSRELKRILRKEGLDIEIAEEFPVTGKLLPGIIITELEPLLKTRNKGPGQTQIICYTENDDEYAMLSAIDSGADSYMNVTKNHLALISTVRSIIRASLCERPADA